MSGPGVYVADSTEGIASIEDLPQPYIIKRSRNFSRRACPSCCGKTYRKRTIERKLHELGEGNRPKEIHVTVSQHFCPSCKLYFLADTSDLAAPGGRYTHSVVQTAVRLVVEDGLPYRLAAWHLWRDHRVHVPFGTIQNWCEAAGKKSGRSRKGMFLS